MAFVLPPATVIPPALSSAQKKETKSLPPRAPLPFGPSILRGAPFHSRARSPSALPSSAAPPSILAPGAPLHFRLLGAQILDAEPPSSSSSPRSRILRIAPSRIRLLGAEAPLICSATYRIRLLGAEAPLIRSVAPLQDPPRGRLTNPRSPAPASCSAPASSRHVPHPRPSPSTPPRGATEPRRPCSEYPCPRQRDLRPNIDRDVLHRHAKLRSHGDPATLSCLQANR